MGVDHRYDDWKLATSDDNEWETVYVYALDEFQIPVGDPQTKQEAIDHIRYIINSLEKSIEELKGIKDGND